MSQQLSPRDRLRLQENLYYTQADEMGCTFVGSKPDCLAAIADVFPTENAEQLFKKYFTNDWNMKYPLVIKGKLQNNVIVGADEDKYVVAKDSDNYVIPESEAVAAGYDVENQRYEMSGRKV